MTKRKCKKDEKEGEDNDASFVMKRPRVRSSNENRIVSGSSRPAYRRTSSSILESSRRLLTKAQSSRDHDVKVELERRRIERARMSFPSREEKGKGKGKEREWE